MMTEDFMHLVRSGKLEDGATAGDDSDCLMLSIAISLMGLRVAVERIANRMDDIASGTATIRIQNEF